MKMVVRRIREHVVQHNWFAVGIDLVIVVLGVFLGTQVSNWNQDRLDRAQGHEYRLRLIADLAANEADLNDRRKYYIDVLRHAEAALAALDQPPGASDEKFLIDTYQASKTLFRKLKRLTYDEIGARGATAWIGEPKLRDVIANYYIASENSAVTFDAVPSYREVIRQAMPSSAQRAVRRDCAERVYYTADGAIAGQLPRDCRLDLDATTVARAATQVREVPNLARDLTRLIADLDVKISLTAPMARHARSLRERIAAVDGAAR